MFKWLRYFVLFPLASLLPLPLAYRLAGWLYRHDPVLRRPTREAVATALGKISPEVLPEVANSEQMPALLDHYQTNLGHELLDVYYLPRLTSRNIDRWVDIDGLDLLAAPRPDGRGRILAMAHYGRPSLLFAALGAKGVKLHILTQVIDTRNPYLDRADRWFLRFKVWGNRQANPGEWLTIADNPRQLYQLLKDGDTVVILFDVPPNPGDATQAAPFLGRTLKIPQGLQRLAERTGAALCYGAVHDSGWRARVTIEPLPEESVDAAVKGAISLLERDVRQNPAHWWQWICIDALLFPL
ncbi:MAG: hypothetical protein D4S02_05615 [Rhodocyclaceae bacterium]|nr:MAG: hypothetical protein D4S02_05615 [Rhodocyclaceae bacterium]